MHFNTRVMLIDDIHGKSNKAELKSSCNYSTTRIKSKSHHWLFMASAVYTHTHACADVHTHTFVGESDFKKPGLKSKETSQTIQELTRVIQKFIPTCGQL